MRALLGEQEAVEVVKRAELRTFQVMPRRWIVERSLTWLEKNRRLWKNCERAGSTPACSSFISLFWPYCSGAREHAPRATRTARVW